MVSFKDFRRSLLSILYRARFDFSQTSDLKNTQMQQKFLERVYASFRKILKQGIAEELDIPRFTVLYVECDDWNNSFRTSLDYIRGRISVYDSLERAIHVFYWNKSCSGAHFERIVSTIGELQSVVVPDGWFNNRIEGKN